MGRNNYVWIFGEASPNLNVIPSDGNVARRLRDLNGMGIVGLYVPPSERFEAVLDSFRQDEELQQYFISKTVCICFLLELTQYDLPRFVFELTIRRCDGCTCHFRRK